MVVILFFVGLAIVMAFFALASKKGWLKIHDDPNVMQLFGVVGVIVLVVVLFFLLLIAYGIKAAIDEHGILYLLAMIGIVILIGAVVFALGYAYFRYRREKGIKEVEELRLGD